MRVLIGQDVLIPQLIQRTPLPGREACNDEIIVRTTPAATWQELIADCPPGWKPDVYIHWSPEYNAVPFGIEEADCLTLAVFGDWNLGAHAMHLIAGAFDVIFADRRGAEVLRQAGYTNTRYTLIWGHELHLHYRLPDVERDIDILMVGNFNHQVQWERERWLARVARLSAKYRVLLSSNVYGEEYTRLMNRAKIVFNRSVGGGINMRTYEAPACGAMLFQERENTEIEALFEEGKECVLYGDEDLETLLDYYLAPENTQERERITENGYRKVQGHDRLHHFSQFIEQVEACVAERRRSTDLQPRTFALLPAFEQDRRIATQWLVSLQPETLSRLADELNRLSEEANTAPEECALPRTAPAAGEDARHRAAELSNIKSVFMGEWALRSETAEKERALIEAARQALAAIQLEPDFVTAHCNLGWIYGEMRLDQEAAGAFRQAITLLEAQDLQARQIRSIFFPRDYKFFNVMHEKLLCEHAPGSAEWHTELRALLLGVLCGTLAELAFKRGAVTQSAQLSERAVAFTPNCGRFYYGLGAGYQRLGRTEDALQAYEQARTLSPFLVEAWLDQAKLSLQARNPEQAVKITDELAAIIDGCPCYSSFRPSVEQLRQESYRAAEAAASKPAVPLRLLALPDWNKAEEWQPLLRQYVQNYGPGDPIKLFLPVEPGRHPNVDRIVSGMERYLNEELNISIDMIPDVILLTESFSAMNSADKRQLAHALVLLSDDGNEDTNENDVPSDFAGLPLLPMNRIDCALSLLAVRTVEPVCIRSVK